jgi:hypothetical protein
MLEVAERPGLVERYEVWLYRKLRRKPPERTRREYSKQVAGFVEWLLGDPSRGSDAFFVGAGLRGQGFQAASEAQAAMVAGVGELWRWRRSITSFDQPARAA